MNSLPVSANSSFSGNDMNGTLVQLANNKIEEQIPNKLDDSELFSRITDIDYAKPQKLTSIMVEVKINIALDMDKPWLCN